MAEAVFFSRVVPLSEKQHWRDKTESKQLPCSVRLPGLLPQRLCEGSTQLPPGSTFTPLAACLFLGRLPLSSPKVATRTCQTLKTAGNSAVSYSYEWGSGNRTFRPESQPWAEDGNLTDPATAWLVFSSFFYIPVSTLPTRLFYPSVPSVP